jgi:hypothetical protein
MSFESERWSQSAAFRVFLEKAISKSSLFSNNCSANTSSNQPCNEPHLAQNRCMRSVCRLPRRCDRKAIPTAAGVVLVVALAVLAALAASTASQTSAAWLARRTPRPQALPSPTGLCAGPPAGRPPDGVRTTQLLVTRAGGLRCDAQAGPCQACSRRSSCALTTGLLLVLRAGVPAPSKAFGEDGVRATQ